MDRGRENGGEGVVQAGERRSARIESLRPIALAGYALIERPFLRLRRRSGPTAATPVDIEHGPAIAPLEAGRGAA
jgi:hypothetical protein